MDLLSIFGAAHNKLLAKMASDFEKPDKVHTLFENEMEEKMWKLDISELFMIGKKTVPKLQKLKIKTIGDLAKSNKQEIAKKFGKHGILMWEYANGIDHSEVIYEKEKPKSIGNSVTLPVDCREEEKLAEILLVLTEQVTFRLRKKEMLASVVGVQLRTKDFHDISHQKKLENRVSNTKEIYSAAKELLKEIFVKGMAVRLVGVRVDNLTEKNEIQLSLFENQTGEKQDKLDHAIDEIKHKYGYDVITRAGKLEIEDMVKIKKKE